VDRFDAFISSSHAADDRQQRFSPAVTTSSTGVHTPQDGSSDATR
jgi:hypothetical protein